MLDSLLLLIKLLAYTSSDRDCCSFRVGGEREFFDRRGIPVPFQEKGLLLCGIIGTGVREERTVRSAIVVVGEGNTIRV